MSIQTLSNLDRTRSEFEIRYEFALHRSDFLRARIGLPERTLSEEVIYFLGRLWRVICLNYHARCDASKVADLFLDEMIKRKNRIEDLAYELSFFSPDQIKELGRLYSREWSNPHDVIRYHQIFDMALVYSTQAHKKVALHRFCNAGAARLPDLSLKYWKPIFDNIVNALKAAHKRPSPTTRRSYQRALGAKDSKLDVWDFHCLKVNKPPMNRVLQYRKLLESAERGAVIHILEKLALFPLFYLYDSGGSPLQEDFMKAIGKKFKRLEDSRDASMRAECIEFFEYLKKFKEVDVSTKNCYEYLLNVLEIKPSDYEHSESDESDQASKIVSKAVKNYYQKNNKASFAQVSFYLSMGGFDAHYSEVESIWFRFLHAKTYPWAQDDILRNLHFKHVSDFDYVWRIFAEYFHDTEPFHICTLCCTVHGY